MCNENTDIEGSFVKTLRDSDLTEVTMDVVELGLDQIIEEGLFQDLPVVSTLVKLAKTGINVRDYFFAKKLLKFLLSFSEISNEERRSMIERLGNDENYKQKVGESLMHLLDRLDDVNKPDLIAKAFKAYSAGVIDAIQLQRINYALERLLMVDIGMLCEFAQIGKEERYDLIIGQNFINAGLAYVGTGYGTGGIHPNDICQVVVRHILEE